MFDACTTARPVLAIAAAFALLATPAQALTLKAFFALPDESRFAYLVGLADGITAGQASIARRNQLAVCIADMGFPALLTGIEAQVSSEPALMQMEVGMVAWLVIDERCDAT